MQRSICDAFTAFREHNLEPILIKGWAIARLYPTNIFRPYSDIDLAFSSRDIESATQVRITNEFKGLVLDIHKELKHLDTLLWSDLYQNSKLVNLNGLSIRVLSDEDHLRVLAVHWLIDGAGSRDRLWDIYFAVANRPPDFDWNKCLSVVSSNRRRWIIYTIGLASKYLGLKIDDLPFADEAKKLPEWLPKAVEREWKSEVKLQPLARFTRHPREFFAQVKKRLPPNPIHATVDMEGNFDAITRIHYQIGTIFKRVGPSVKRLILSLWFNSK